MTPEVLAKALFQASGMSDVFHWPGDSPRFPPYGVQTQVLAAQNYDVLLTMAKPDYTPESVLRFNGGT